jgi:sigma-B regulation protein RsbU (phosphoserine phosphatase)
MRSGDVNESRFGAVAASVQDALIAGDGESRIVFWSPSAERIFGWSETEALGQSLTLLMPERLHQAHYEGIRRVADGGETRIVGGPPVELVAIHRDGTEFPIELTLGRWSEDDDSFFTGVVRDISERRRGERVLETQHAVAAALAASQDLDEGIARALEAIGRGMGWCAGHLWLIDEQSETLFSRAAWSDATPPLERFVAAADGQRFARGEGLPGRAWAARKVVWLQDLERASNFDRRRDAAEAGLRTGVAVPLIADEVDHGVLEFFGEGAAVPHDATLTALDALGRQLAQFLLRREAEAKLQRREEQRMQAAELNDEVVQGLVVAGYLLDRGELEAAHDAVDNTLAAARLIVAGLLGENAPKPGDLRRKSSAQGPTKQRDS